MTDPVAETITVNLTKPIAHGDKTWNALTFRALELGDMIMGDGFDGEVAKTAAILASMAGVPLPAFKHLTAADFKSVMETVGPLMGNEFAPETTGG
jgi:hypothetical protein